MRERKRIVVALAGALLVVAALIAVLVVASGPRGERRLEQEQEHGRLGLDAGEHEAGEEAELERAGRTSPAGYPRVYDSRNTDGKAGSGAQAIAYQAGGRRVSLPASKLPQARLWRTGHGGWEPTFGINQKGTIF